MADRPEGDVSGQSRDELLCFCENVAHAAFRDVIWADPETTFEDACARTGVGSKCTSCLLNAETLYVEAVETRPKTARQSARLDRARPRFDKRTLYGLVDRTMPQVSRTTNGIIPIVTGPQVRTILTIANSVATSIGPRSSTFRFEMTFRDPDGAVHGTRKARLAPGERLDIDISEGLEHGGTLMAGGAWMRWRAEAPGFFGTIRPHFKIVTPVSVTAVHSQGRGIGRAFFQTIAINPAETQYLSAMNCESRPTVICMRAVQAGTQLAQVDTPVPAFGSRLIPVPLAELAERTQARPFGLEVASDTETRWHLLVCEGTPPRISLDHG